MHLCNLQIKENINALTLIGINTYGRNIKQKNKT